MVFIHAAIIAYAQAGSLLRLPDGLDADSGGLNLRWRKAGWLIILFVT
jgi:hypothetical protein